MRRFEGQHALVTGGANGIGFACATRLAEEGASVGIVDINAEAAGDAARRLSDKGLDVRACPADVTDPAQVSAVFDAFESDHGSIEVLVNMAGIFPSVPFADMTLESWRSITAVNLDAVFVTCHDVLPRMRRNGYGRIGNASSGVVKTGMFSSAAYISAKAGVVGLTRFLAREGGPDGITVNTIMPGPIATPQIKNIIPAGQTVEEAMAPLTSLQCVPRPGLPEDIAEGVAYACSPGAGFYTGQVLYIGGGDTFTG
ncbi:3-oxoacyl-ACP reductase [Amycolatopsis deserti]|uniref:3-oxoacyl-ACP reductase n=1 Tax=Amycolatopsis deserti TaxID=185696 RepID=A0ABQ3IGT9_9PSEU|nr:SDR family NAD(P)-dependent oxidoreductase [Amycolatopsis deserti]GHE80614.1 3-oxoacyl-ACP reductase [Amycolatopsis deserti]